MAEKTKNYGLTKPLPEDFYDVQVQNDNMDIIDEEIKKVADVTDKILDGDGLGVYSKDETLSENTSSLYNVLGMTDVSTPDKVFRLFSTHWWERRSIEVDTEVTETSELVTKMEKGVVTSTTVLIATVYIANSYSFTDGKFILTNPTSMSWTIDTHSTLQTALTGKYFIFNKSSDTTMYYGGGDDSNAFFVNAAQSGTQYYPYMSYLTEYTVVTNTVEVIGEVEYVSSAEGSTYPSVGRANGYEYKYLGIPFINAREGVKIQTGSYVGTGTISNVINFNKLKPRIVFIISGSTYTLNDSSTSAGVRSFLVAIWGVPSYWIGTSGDSGSTTFGARGGYRTSNGRFIGSKWNETTLFLSGDSPVTSENVAGETYYYVAIG